MRCHETCDDACHGRGRMTGVQDDRGGGMFVSYDLRDCRGFPACRGADYIRLGAGLHAAVEPGQGLISSRRGQGLDLQFYDITDQAAWLELGLRLAGPGRDRRARAWRGSRRFYCRLRLAYQTAPQPAGLATGALADALADPQAAAPAAPETRGEGPPPAEPPVQARLALRLHQPEGFDDIFAPDPLPLCPKFSWIRAEIDLPPRAQAALQGVDLHLFLPPRDGGLQVSDLGVTAAI